MNTKRPPPPHPSPPEFEFSRGVIRSELQRLLQDPDFPASEIRRKFLKHVVEATISGRGEKLKGVALAQDVFDRDADFDQQADPIVRIEARRLRRDLDSYYANHADRSVIRFSIPKGAYLVTFEPRLVSEFASDRRFAAHPYHVKAMLKPRLSRPVIVLLGIILLLLLAVIVAFNLGKTFSHST